MEAAGGAQQQVERLEAAVEEARRKLAYAEQQLYAWRQGAEGELRTAAVLDDLRSAGWVVLHDVHWPGRTRANLDHVAIGPTGVFVVDSKNWSGTVIVKDGTLRQNGYSRAAACEGAASSAAAVAAFLEPQHRSLVTTVVCLVGQATPASQPRVARVVGLDDLRDLLTAGPARLSPTEVAAISGYLKSLLDGSTSPEQKTTAALVSAGIAPMEPRRATSRRPRSHAPTARPRRRRQGSARRSRRLGLDLARLILVAVVLIFVLPAVLKSYTSSLSVPPPTAPTASVPAHPSTTPAVKRTSRTHPPARSTTSGHG